MKPGVFITFDVECSMGGAWGDSALKPVPPARAIWGEYGDAQFGLPLIVRILEESALAATFFVEAFAHEQGYPGEMERVCHYLLEHGQDVQLHVHPNHKHFGLALQGKPYPKDKTTAESEPSAAAAFLAVGSDTIADLKPSAQLALLQEGSERIERWTGDKTVAFRAGNMGASEVTLQQLERVGIPIDSSYTFPYAGGQSRFSPDHQYNGSKWYGKVLELALSGFRQRRMPGLHAAKPVDLVGISAAECVSAIRAICDAEADTVLILHSFSLLKVCNVQYDGGRLNRIVSRRFRSVCRWLAEHASDFPTCTFTDVAAAIGDGTYEARSVAPCMLGNPLRSYLRKGVQAWNRSYWT